jgi:hypothetical protein
VPDDERQVVTTSNRLKELYENSGKTALYEPSRHEPVLKNRVAQELE